MLVNIKDIYQKVQELCQLEETQRLKELNKLEKIKVGGWVKSIRESKEKVFIALNDGSTASHLQIIISRKNFLRPDLLEKVNFASSLLVSGGLMLTPEREQSCELQVSKIELVNSAAND